MNLRVVGEFDTLWTAGAESMDERYKGSGVVNPNVTELTTENREKVVSELMRMNSGLRYVSGGANIGKTTRVTKMIADLCRRKVIVVEPTSALASNAAFSYNEVHKADLAVSLTHIGSHLSGSGGIAFMGAEIFLREHSFGQKFSSDVGMLIVDECHSGLPEMMAAMDVAKQMAREIPVVAMSATLNGKRTAHRFDGIDLKSYATEAEAPKGKRLVFCESMTEARRLANGGLVLSAFLSYASCQRIYEACRKEGDVTVYADYKCSEGFNFPFDVIIDCQRRLVVANVESELVLKFEPVPDADHIQRACRLRSGGVYHGADVKKLGEVVIEAKPSLAEEAMLDWWRKALKLPSNPTKAAARLSRLIGGNINVFDMATAHCQGRDWYDDEKGGSEKSDDGDERTVYELEPVVIEETKAPNKRELVSQRNKHSRDRSAYELEPVVIEGTKAPNKRELVSQRNKHNRDRSWPVSIVGPEREEPDTLVCFVVLDKWKMEADVEILGEKIETLRRGGKVSFRYSLDQLVVLVACRNHFIYSYEKTGDSKARRIVELLEREYRANFELAVKASMFGSIYFAYVDWGELKVHRSANLNFLGPEEYSVADDERELYKDLFGALA